MKIEKETINEFPYAVFFVSLGIIIIAGFYAVKGVTSALKAAKDDANYSMNNDEIITETKKCESAGLEARPVTSFSSRIIDIQCVPKAN